MSVLITGGAGFVGLNVAEQLLRTGESVVLFGLEPPPEAAMRLFNTLPGRLHVSQGDIRDEQLLRQVMQENSVQRVVHGAAITAGLAREATQGLQIAQVNIGGTIILLEAAAQLGVKRVVQLGSGSVFGSSVKQDGRLDEESDIPIPDTLYGITKYAAERIALRYRQTRHLDVAVARLGVVFGRWEYDTKVRDTLSTPLALNTIAESGGHAAFCDNLPDDWVYATDVAHAILLLLNAPELARPVYQIGTGHRWSITSWCERLREHYPDFTYSIVSDPAQANVGRQTPVPRPPFSIDRLQADLNYQVHFPEKAAFDDYLAWRRERPC